MSGRKHIRSENSREEIIVVFLVLLQNIVNEISHKTRAKKRQIVKWLGAY